MIKSVCPIDAKEKQNISPTFSPNKTYSKNGLIENMSLTTDSKSQNMQEEIEPVAPRKQTNFVSPLSLEISTQ